MIYMHVAWVKITLRFVINTILHISPILLTLLTVYTCMLDYIMQVNLAKTAVQSYNSKFSRVGGRGL